MDTESGLADELKAFTYTDAAASWWTRKTTRLIEQITGQPFFVNLYLSWHAAKPVDESLFAAAFRLLDIDLAYDESRLAQWPHSGPLVVACNHPFGVIDGLGACRLALQRRGDVRILINAVLNCIDDLAPHALPVDFTETADALRINLDSRRRALDHIRAGGCVIVFPAGGISTTPRLIARKATDTPWKSFVAKLVQDGGAAVAPLFFPGQNSAWFQIASHISMDLRLALMFRETRRLMGTRIEARLGEVLRFEDLRTLDRAALTRRLRDAVYAQETG